MEALRLRGRPSKAEALAIETGRGVAGKANDLAEASWQFDQLQQKIGQQQLGLDFFKEALRHVEASRRAPGERNARRDGVFACIQAMTRLG